MPEWDMLSLGVMGMGAGGLRKFFRRRRRRRRPPPKRRSPPSARPRRAAASGPGPCGVLLY